MMMMMMTLYSDVDDDKDNDVYDDNTLTNLSLDIEVKMQYITCIY